MVPLQTTHRTVVMALAIVLLTPVGASADAGLYKERCAKCHARASALASGLKGETKEDKAAALDAFLMKHHADDAQVRAELVAYLVGLSAK
jgi:hypothetical protein